MTDDMTTVPVTITGDTRTVEAQLRALDELVSKLGARQRRTLMPRRPKTKKRRLDANAHLAYSDGSEHARHLTPAMFTRVTGSTKQQHVAKKKAPVIA